MTDKKNENLVPFIYTGEYLREISFPLGGIGAGCIGLGGNGRLCEWEIFNRPNKNNPNGYSFFALKAEEDGRLLGARILSGDYDKDYMGFGQGTNRFGSGVNRETLSGFPHFSRVRFTGKYPIAEIDFEEGGLPLGVRLSAFNPFIPSNDKDSSLPCAIFTYEVTNRHHKTLDITLAGNVYNPHRKQSVNLWFDEDGQRGIRYGSASCGKNDAEYGEVCLATNASEVSKQTYLYRGRWFDAMTVFWEDFTASGRFCDRVYDVPHDDTNKNLAFEFRDAGTVASHYRLAPGEKCKCRFVISWYYPNFVNYWNPGNDKKPDGNPLLPSWKNYYATLFDGAAEVSAYVLAEYQRLYGETKTFRDALFSSTLPDYVLDAIAGNMSTLKTPTCARLTDGTLYGFEGCHAEWESCEGSCTHVWNYDQTTPFLFPALARSMHDIYYRYCGDNTGKYMFRMMLPPERTGKIFPNHNGRDRAAADGQMGVILRMYREWKISGNTDWLRRLWPKVKQSLEYAWSPTNEYGWDADCDGIMEGRQHQTLDVELFGPNPFVSGIYQAALLAAAEMAKAMGEADSARKYQALFQKGNAKLNDEMFNGEYFYQPIDLEDGARFELSPEVGQITNQIGEGCHIDQTIAQWYAAICGLDRVFEKEKSRSALRAIYRHNFGVMGQMPNPCRVFAMNDEQGVVVCTWPKGNQPKIPVPYSGECMYGMEHQAAANMIYEGLVKEGLDIVQACRSRFDGKKRNPWNEYESGSNYARSMSAYSLLLALSGFAYDGVAQRMTFAPPSGGEDFTCFWSVDGAWGRFILSAGQAKLEVLYGMVKLRQWALPLAMPDKTLTLKQNGRPLSFALEDGALVLQESLPLQERDVLIAAVC